MKWMLLIILFNGQPVETKLFYDSLKECYQSSFLVAGKPQRYFRDHVQGYAEEKRARLEKAGKFDRLREGIGLANKYVCIPYAGTPPKVKQHDGFWFEGAR